MKRGIQGVARREQPKLPITKSVAGDTIGEFLRDSQKYNLSLSEISRELMSESRKNRGQSHCCPINID
jgi:hypothetical protein